MRNHLNLVLEMPQPNLVFGMKWRLGVCTKRREWVLGREEFRRELLAAVAGQVGANHYGAGRQEPGEPKAERIVREELKRLGWREDELPGRPKWHSGKVMMARRLRQGTTLSLQWNAQRLPMGTWTYVSNLLNKEPESPAAQEVLPLRQ